MCSKLKWTFEDQLEQRRKWGGSFGTAGKKDLFMFAFVC